MGLLTDAVAVTRVEGAPLSVAVVHKLMRESGSVGEPVGQGQGIRHVLNHAASNHAQIARVLITTRHEEPVMLLCLVQHLGCDAIQCLLSKVTLVLRLFGFVAHDGEGPPLCAKYSPRLVAVKSILCDVEGCFDVFVMYIGTPALMLLLRMCRHTGLIQEGLAGMIPLELELRLGLGLGLG